MRAESLLPRETRVRTLKAFFAVAVLASLLRDGVAAEPKTVVTAPSRFDHFITRQGDKLMDGDQEFRFIGANMPGLVLPYDWTLYLPERLHLPTPWEQEDAFKTLDQMNLPRGADSGTCRSADPKEASRKPWHYVQGPGQFNEESFKVVDHLFALANSYGVRVIFDFTAESGDYLGGIGTYAAHRGKKRAEFYTDPQLKEDYKATVRYVLTRTNTITGVPLPRRQGDPGLAVRQRDAQRARRLALGDGGLHQEPRPEPPGGRDAPSRRASRCSSIRTSTCYTRHLYSNYAAWAAAGPARCRREMAKLNGQRPFFIGEFGPYIDGKMFTHENVVDEAPRVPRLRAVRAGHLRRAALEHVLPPPGRRLLLAPDHDLSRPSGRITGPASPAPRRSARSAS